MITRPLELASRLRPEPRSLDALFFVNAALLVLFFDLFGSRFVLAPGLGVDLPHLAGARAGASQPTHHISVTQSGLIFNKEGPVVTMEKLKAWLKKEGDEWRLAAGKNKLQPSLLVEADKEVQVGKLTQIAEAAGAAGFTVVWGAEEAVAGEGGKR